MFVDCTCCICLKLHTLSADNYVFLPHSANSAFLLAAADQNGATPFVKYRGYYMTGVGKEVDANVLHIFFSSTQPAGYKKRRNSLTADAPAELAVAVKAEPTAATSPAAAAAGAAGAEAGSDPSPAGQPSAKRLRRSSGVKLQPKDEPAEDSKPEGSQQAPATETAQQQQQQQLCAPSDTAPATVSGGADEQQQQPTAAAHGDNSKALDDNTAAVPAAASGAVSGDAAAAGASPLPGSQPVHQTEQQQEQQPAGVGEAGAATAPVAAGTASPVADTAAADGPQALSVDGAALQALSQDGAGAGAGEQASPGGGGGGGAAVSGRGGRWGRGRGGRGGRGGRWAGKAQAFAAQTAYISSDGITVYRKVRSLLQGLGCRLWKTFPHTFSP